MAKKSKANGEGTISKRKNGKYCGQLSCGRDTDGKLIRKTVYGDSYDECRKNLNELVHERDKGKLVRKSNMSVGELAKHYYLNVKFYKVSATDKKAGISNSTWNWYVDNVNRYIYPKLSNTPLEKFNSDDTTWFFNSLTDTLSPSSIAGVKRTLNPVMKYAVSKLLMANNPLNALKLPSDDNDDDDGDNKPLFIEKDDLKKIIEKLDEFKKTNQYTGLRDIILTCTYTGMRISEVLGLRIRDIDLVKGYVYVRKQSKRCKIRDKDGKIIAANNEAGALKTKDSKRNLPISKIWEKVLIERINTLKSFNNPDLLKPDAFIFCNREGDMRTYSGTRSSFERFMKRIEFEDKGYTIHAFRHSFISHAKANGLDKDDVTRYVGHASSTITNKIYTHLTEEGKQKITSSIDGAFSDLISSPDCNTYCNRTV